MVRGHIISPAPTCGLSWGALDTTPAPSSILQGVALQPLPVCLNLEFS